MRDTTRPIKNQDCYSKKFRSILASDARFVRRVRRGKRAEKICGRKVRPMSSRVAQRHAAGSYDSCGSRVSASGRLAALVAALMITLATLFASTAMPRQASAADDSQTNFDSWTAAAQNIAKQLATAEKDYNDGDYGQAGTRLPDRALDRLRRIQLLEGRQRHHLRRQAAGAAHTVHRFGRTRLPARPG